MELVKKGGKGKTIDLNEWEPVTIQDLEELRDWCESELERISQESMLQDKKEGTMTTKNNWQELEINGIISLWKRNVLSARR